MPALCAGPILFAASLAQAQTAPILSINCPTMTEELQSSLEARARAELAMQGAWSGALQVHCVAPLLVVEYSKPGFVTRSSSTSLPSDVDHWVENILVLIHEVTTINVQAPITPQKSDQLSMQQPPKELTSTAPAVAAAAPNQLKTRKPDRPPHDGSIKPSSAMGETSSIKPVAGLGLCTDVWFEAGNALLGPCAAAGVRLSRRWRLAATGGAQWAAAQSDSIAIRGWHVGLDLRFGRNYWFAFGSELSAIRLSSSSGTLPSKETIYDPAARLRVGLSRPLAKHQLAVGAGLKLSPQYFSGH